MTKVNTVLGTIPAEELEIVAVHEHIGYGMPGSELDTKWWKSPEQAYEETVPKLRKFREYGGGTFVDATGICNGRDVDYYKSLSRKTGVNIVACTGFVGGDTALPHFSRATVDYLAKVFIHEITVGIGDTGAKAGVIKVGVSRGGRMTELDKRIYRAAARAAVVTGAPILTHLAIDPEPAVSIFNEEGLDTFGYDLELPDPPFWGRKRAERMEHFVNLVNKGYADKLLVSADANCSPLGWPGVKGHTINYIFEDMIPDMRAAGIDDTTLKLLLEDNPADFLSLHA
jgi:predicted metal-dependent phosphotriesterase family hydrolase